ncbi:TonB-dependent receptor [Caulobacter sp.]|uniref:TonB-dependent receptor n=1 Tax=Caulobacter sp. TaxID=78 RepID=UPI002B47A2DC|nr:TonB-dependent receptor [Caulobacter sp.]HJV40920.1 TonB-dependent receptor [Caulobacter sp.]
MLSASTRGLLANGVSALALLTLAVATEARASGQTAQSDTTVQEVTVTARRRDEALQDVPASMTVLSAQTLERAGVEKAADFVGMTSNVTLVETQNAGNAFIVIRGISQARNSEPSVAVIVDGVQQVNPAQFNQELFDIEQIEVLKGPQGALYGRNAIGGAIVIRTKQPTNEFQGNLKAGIESGPGYKVQGSLSGPVGKSETLKFRLAGSYVDNDGYIRNTYLDQKADPYKDVSLRGVLLWQPTDKFSADLRLSGAKLKTRGFYFNIVNDVNDTSLPVRVNNPGIDNRDMYSASLKLNYDTDAGTLTSVSSYDTLKEIVTGDAFDFLPIQQSLFFKLLGFDLNQSQYVHVDAYSQELRFASPVDRKVRWIAGAYGIATKRYISTGNMVDTGAGVFPVYRTPSTNPLNPQATFLADNQSNLAWAVFGDVTTNLTSKVELDVSLRYDKDRRRQTTLTPTAFLPNVPGFPQGATGDVRRHIWDELQPKVTLRYEPTDAVSLYTGYSRGFRSGGFNQTGVGGVAFSNGIVGVSDLFEAEVATTYEAGIKSTLFEKRLTLNASAYTTKSKNSYFFVFLAANSTQNLGNVPEVRLNGFELDATARPISGLDINLGLGYTDSDIKAFPNAAYIGNQAPLVSRYTLNLTGQYRHPLGGTGLDLLTRVEYRRIGKTWFDVENSTVRKPIDLVDARLGVEGESWSLTAWSQNLTDKRYNAEFSPGGFVFKAKPRRYGVEFTKRF